MSESEHNFQDVKQLLKLKRHEVPPPGYFNNFSSQVISRIRAGEQESATFAEKVQGNSWLHNLLHIFDARPGVIGGLATSACLLVVFGLVLSEHPDSNAGGFAANAQTPQVFASNGQSGNAPEGVPAAPAMVDPLAAVSTTGITLSTNPVTSLQPVASLFGQPGGSPLLQPVGFSTGH
jgi:hypothetical protein